MVVMGWLHGKDSHGRQNTFSGVMQSLLKNSFSKQAGRQPVRNGKFRVYNRVAGRKGQQIQRLKKKNCGQTILVDKQETG